MTQARQSTIPDQDSVRHGVTNAQIVPTDASSIEEEIRRRAYGLWEERGRPDGTPDEDWLRAERELLSQPATE